jgi:hypothetical protein
MKKLEEEVMSMFETLTPMNQSVVAAEIKRAYLVEQAVREQYGLEATPPQDRQPA